jgi:protein involved in polysaccharide export with SLBB domain
MIHRVRFGAVLLAAVVLVGPLARAQSNAVAFTAESIRSMDSLDDRQLLGPGDRISYRVIEDRDASHELLITDSGDLEVPYLGLVHAAGKTCRQLASQIKGLLEKKLYYTATVMISAQVINRTRVLGKVYVTGQVRNSGTFDIPAGDPMTVSRAILSAGGFSDFSDKRNVRLVRKTASGSRTFVVNVQAVLESGKLSGDMPVQPGDLIVVPERLVKW